MGGDNKRQNSQWMVDGGGDTNTLYLGSKSAPSVESLEWALQENKKINK